MSTTLGGFLALGVLSLVLGLGAWGEHEKVKALQATTSELKASLKTCTDANTSNQATLAQQEAALKTWQDTAKAQTSAAQNALQDARKAAAQRDTLAARIKTMEAADATQPGCDGLLATDLAKVCPGHAQAVLERAQ